MVRIDRKFVIFAKAVDKKLSSRKIGCWTTCVSL